MGKSDNKSRTLGDDPLAWLNADADANKKQGKKKPSPKTKKSQKAKSVKNKSEKATPKKANPKKSSPKKASPKKKNKTDNTGSSAKKFVLESSLIINNASDIYESLKKLAASGQDIEIDASKVEIIDSAILQLFFSFVLNIKEKNIKLTWYKPTEGLLNKASTLGLSKQLGF